MEAKLIRSEKNGLIHYQTKEGRLFLLDMQQDNVFKLPKDIIITENTTGYKIDPLRTTDGTATYRLVSAPGSVTIGGGGRKGVSVFDDGTLIGFTQNLNFTGDGVTVTIVNGQAVINIPDGGAGMIGGGGTLNRIPKFTPDGSNIGDSLLFDNGTTVQMGGTGAIASAQFAMTSTTQGFLAPRMTTVNRDAIAAPATGLLVYNTSTSLFSYWDGAAWQNIDSQAGGDVSGSGTTNFIPRWTDGPNSVLGDSVIRDNGTVAAVNRAVIAATMFAIQGADAGAVNYTFETYNSTPIKTFGVRNDGYITAGIANGSMTIGLSAGFNNTLAGNTFIGVSAGAAITTGTQNTALGTEALSSNTTATSQVAIGYRALRNTTIGSSNTAIGENAMASNVDGSDNTAVGRSALTTNVSGINNTAIGEFSLISCTGNSNTAVGYGSMQSGTSASQNTSIGVTSLFTNSTGTFNVALGYAAGYYEVNSEKLWIDNTTRASLADGITKALVYGQFNAATASQFFRVNANMGIGTSTFGTNSDFVFSMINGTAPTTSPADQFQMYSADQAAGNAVPHFRTENGGIIKLYVQTLTNSTGGAASGDLEDVTTLGLADPAKINNNFTEIFTILDNLGLV